MVYMKASHSPPGLQGLIGLSHSGQIIAIGTTIRPSLIRLISRHFTS